VTLVAPDLPATARRSWGSILLGPAAVAAGTVAVLAYDPFADHGRLGCPLHEMTGLLCPGCGATRAWWLVLHGDLAGAVRSNLFLLPALAWLAVHWFAASWPRASRRLPGWLRSSTAIPPGALRAVAALLVVYAVLRNLPAFEWLAPPRTT